MAKKSSEAAAASSSADTEQKPNAVESARTRLAATGRNDVCPCGSGKKYKKCHLPTDESAVIPPTVAPDPQQLVQQGWRLFEQRRPGAAEKEFRAALTLKPDLVEAQVGVGLAKLSSGDSDGARAQLDEVVKGGGSVLADLRKEGVTDAFSRKEAQPFLRASHALGCLAYDQDRLEDALVDFERVYAIDKGPVGTEARLVAGKTLLKQKKPADAIAVLGPAAESQNGPGRAYMGLCLAHFQSGDRAAAETALGHALEANAYFGKAILGQVRRQVENPLAATPGSREEAVVYAQTYGDAWDDAAKAFLGEALAAVAAKPKPDAGADEAAAG
jgi:tetratricopeptide (TPR) repeat protein